MREKCKKGEFFSVIVKKCQFTCVSMREIFASFSTLLLIEWRLLLVVNIIFLINNKLI